MEQTQNQQSGLHYDRLGGRTLLVLIFRELNIFVLYVLIVIVVYALIFFLAPFNILLDALSFLMPAISVGVIIFAINYFTALIKYRRYSISAGDDGLRVTQGFVSAEEVGLPYRKIKDIKIERGLSEQLWGVSNIIITMLGENEGEQFSAESEVILPAVGKDIAQKLQEYVLDQADVEEIRYRPQTPGGPVPQA